MFNIYSHKSLVRSSVRQLLSQECKEEEVYESYFQTVASHSSRRWYLLLLSSQMGTATFNSSLWTLTFCFYSRHSISCSQSTISPQTVSKSQHCGRCKSLKRLLGTLLPFSRKVMLSANLQPLSFGLFWVEVFQRNHPGKRCKDLRLGTRIRRDSKTCDLDEAFRQASRRQ